MRRLLIAFVFLALLTPPLIAPGFVKRGVAWCQALECPTPPPHEERSVHW